MRKKKEAAEAAKAAKEADDDALDGIEGLQDLGRVDDEEEPAVVDPDRPLYGDAEREGSERSFYEDE